jgi:hypothetical protein
MRSSQKDLKEFLEYAAKLKGDEKGEAQLFCDRFFRAFGHGGIIEANGVLEARIKFSTTGRTKFADCLWSPPGRDGVLIEMKKRGEPNLEMRFPQVRDYWIEMNPEKVLGLGAQKPVYIMLCNFDRFLIYRNLSPVDEVKLEELMDRASAFNFMLPQFREPIFHQNVEAISKTTAATLGELFKHLVFERKEKREVAQQYVLQSVLALFSEDFGLLPNGLFSELISESKVGQKSYDLIGSLFRQMASVMRARGGRYKEVPYFNGGLFDAVEPLELDEYSLQLLRRAAKENWKAVNPAIFGSLFESTLSKAERHAYGAHFTSEADIQKIVNPTIVRPWKERIDKARTLSELKRLHDELAAFTVFDPACGCGNFLYVAFHAIKDIEIQLIEKIARSFTRRAFEPLQLGVSRVTTRQFRGIDILPVAVEIAKTTMMVAKEIAADAWNRRVAPLMESIRLEIDPGLPLDRLDNYICRGDALLDQWPDFDAVIGNPPFQSKNKMQQEMDATYIQQVREKYPEVPGRADYCVYWFRRTHDEMKPGQRAGLVGTNTIRQNYSRQGGLDYIIAEGGTITEAVSSQVWSGEAVVHVSLVNWIKGTAPGRKQLSLQVGDGRDGHFSFYERDEINSALSAEFDVTQAKRLLTNSKLGYCYQGQTHGHKAFLLEKKKAEEIIAKDSRYRDVLFPFMTGKHELLGSVDSLPQRYVIDFRKYDAFEAREYPVVFNILKKEVLPERRKKADDEAERNKRTRKQNPKAKVNLHHANFLRQWWKLSYARDE